MKVIFNADDYGVHPDISRGIREAMIHGVVRSTSVLSNCVTDEELEELKKLSSRGISVGVHLNLTRGRPVAFFPQGMLRADGSFEKTAVYSPMGVPVLDSQLLRCEFEAQIEKLAPFEPTHLDGHHHIHSFWNTFSIASRLAKHYGLALRAVNADMRKALKRRGIPCCDYFISGFFGKNNVSVANLMALLKVARPSGAAIVEVMCHPGYWGRLPARFSSYRKERERELEVLTSRELKRALSREGVDVVSYHEL